MSLLITIMLLWWMTKHSKYNTMYTTPTMMTVTIMMVAVAVVNVVVVVVIVFHMDIDIVAGAMLKACHQDYIVSA